MAKKQGYIQAEAFEEESEIQPEERAKKVAFRSRLAEKLQDPEFRKIEGFPIGTDEAIMAVSDPPYYTACPNPFLEQILQEWQLERRELRSEMGLPNEDTLPEGMKSYHREPFAADVSEGKNDPIYNAHSYHTKVPHKAIMRYILHYTDPGDIVFDGFCGTGMTGVAAQLCGDRKAVESLGYYVNKKGFVYETPPSEEESNKPFSRLGARKAVLNDLSPAATFIAHNYNTPVNARLFEKEAKRILAEVEKECGWMYETQHIGGEAVKGRINFTVWSDAFRCTYCGTEMVFWDVAVDQTTKSIKDVWNCPGCNSLLAKVSRKESGALRVERVIDTVYDRVLGQTIRQARQVPVLINYSLGKIRYEKRPDTDDLALIQRIENSEIPFIFPKDRMPEGDESRRNDDIGLTHVHHFYTRRSLWSMSYLYCLICAVSDIHVKNRLKFMWQSLALGYTKLNRYGATHYSQVNRMLNGTLYVASLISEVSIHYAFDGKFSRLMKILHSLRSQSNSIVNSSSSSKLISFDNSMDYIFVDPPFGSNLWYSELNFIWESWLGVLTNNRSEAVINKEQHKGLVDYQSLMQASFNEFYRTLKPGRWMTIEFHNSQNAIWIAIQDGLLNAGFMVADVRTLDKGQGTFKQVTSSNAVQQDLIISAYKPTTEFEHKFALSGGTLTGAWEFVRQHLEQLPMPGTINGNLAALGERMPYLLYDRMVAFHLVRGLTIPLSAAEFYMGLSERFLMRDGMAFMPSQASVYDRLRLKADRVQQLALFVTDESSAIQWLRGELDANGSRTYSDLQPKFLRQLQQEKYEKLPELQQILKQNFLKDEEDRWFTPDPDNQAHLEALRERELLHEFNEYTTGTGRLKVFRAEAVKAGFSKAWGEHDYALIVKVGERLPEQALQEDAKLKLYYDNAFNRAPKEIRQERLI
jgi:hypothetical protein